jgi:hypothetical protein
VALLLWLAVVNAVAAAVSDSAAVKKAAWIASIRDSATPVEAKLNLIDSLAYQFDPTLFGIFKELAFRFPGRAVNLRALIDMSSFVGTYRWSEVCDTLTDVMLDHPDPDMRDSALQANKISYQALSFGYLFDRNNLVDALVAMVAPQTYIRRAKSFYAAVWLLSNVARSTDTGAIGALTYLRDHYDGYELTDAITAADAYWNFRQNIPSVYLATVRATPHPPLITTLPEGAQTEACITMVGYMLDSVATDSIGFAALGRLGAGGDARIGDERERLTYLRSAARRKRPDIADAVIAALDTVLPRFGAGAGQKPQRRAGGAASPVAIHREGRRLIIEQCAPGDRVAVFDGAGRLLHAAVAGSERVVLSAGAARAVFVRVNHCAASRR